jgi:hypothetical protein
LRSHLAAAQACIPAPGITFAYRALSFLKLLFRNLLWVWRPLLLGLRTTTSLLCKAKATSQNEKSRHGKSIEAHSIYSSQKRS